jgi:hypothetical protein
MFMPLLACVRVRVLAFIDRFFIFPTLRTNVFYVHTCLFFFPKLVVLSRHVLIELLHIRIAEFGFPI